MNEYEYFQPGATHRHNLALIFGTTATARCRRRLTALPESGGGGGGGALRRFQQFFSHIVATSC